MNQQKENRNLISDILTSSIPFVEWVSTNFSFDGINVWTRKSMAPNIDFGTPGVRGLRYNSEQLIEQYLREIV